MTCRHAVWFPTPVPWPEIMKAFQRIFLQRHVVHSERYNGYFLDTHLKSSITEDARKITDNQHDVHTRFIHVRNARLNTSELNNPRSKKPFMMASYFARFSQELVPREQPIVNVKWFVSVGSVPNKHPKFELEIMGNYMAAKSICMKQNQTPKFRNAHTSITNRFDCGERRAQAEPRIYFSRGPEELRNGNHVFCIPYIRIDPLNERFVGKQLNGKT